MQKLRFILGEKVWIKHLEEGGYVTGIKIKNGDTRFQVFMYNDETEAWFEEDCLKPYPGTTIQREEEASEDDGIATAVESGGRDVNVGTSDYWMHANLQPWDIIREYKLGFLDGCILKRILRKKAEPNMTEAEARRLDYEKIIQECKERIREIDTYGE